jgi:predicted phosphoadenosine phosphosulfate sulfurtransferase
VHGAASCYELALDRIAHVYDTFDRVVVSFSGGKDSTCCMNLALEVARAKNRLPLEVYTFDEEAIPPETVEYMARVILRPEIAFSWYCVPIQHRNACSTHSPYWYTWAPEDRERWVRELPPTAITDYPGFNRSGIAGQMRALYPPGRGTLANIMGIRTQESLSRHWAVASKKGYEAFMSPGAAPQSKNCYPIYDWQTEDVWIAPKQFGWDYNRAYDLMEGAGLTRLAQRCSPPFGEQPIRRLHTYKTCWPALWAKMVDRVPGAATAARYANTELYAVGVEADDLPPGMTWREWTMQTLRTLPASSQKEAAAAIRVCLSNHNNRSGGAPMPDADPHPISGFAWKGLYLAAKIGGNKFGRVQQKIGNNAIKARKKHGIPA